MEQKRDTVLQAQLLRKSFDLISPEAFTHAFYQRLFSEYPALRPFFVQDLRIQEHALAATLELVADSSGPQADLTSTLYHLGERHAIYGVQAEHYTLLRQVLLETFRELLGERFTPEMDQAWSDALEYISTEMQKGATEF